MIGRGNANGTCEDQKVDGDASSFAKATADRRLRRIKGGGGGRMKQSMKVGAKNGTWPVALTFPLNFAKNDGGGMKADMLQSLLDIPKN